MAKSRPCLSVKCERERADKVYVTRPTPGCDLSLRCNYCTLRHLHELLDISLWDGSPPDRGALLGPINYIMSAP